MMERPDEIRASDVSFLPIIARYVERLGIPKAVVNPAVSNVQVSEEKAMG